MTYALPFADVLVACSKLERGVFATCARTAMDICDGVANASESMRVHHEQALFQAGTV